MNDAPVPGIGERVPVFVARTASKARYAFDTVAGRYVVLLYREAGSSRRAVLRLSSAGHALRYCRARLPAYLVGRRG